VTLQSLVSLKELISVLLGVLLGGAITWYFSRRYYIKASKELQKEASDLLSLSKITLRALEDAGLCKLNRDENGKIKGLAFTLKAEAGSITVTGAVVNTTLQPNRK
jgi:hypothetical protein